MRLSIRLLSLTAVALLAAGSQSYAAFGDFTFATTVSIAGGAAATTASQTVGSSTITLGGESSTGVRNAAGFGTNINFATNAVTTTLTGSNVDTFAKTAFELFLTITSNGSSATADIMGTYSGMVTSTQNDITVSYTSMPSTLIVGGTTFYLSDYAVTQSSLNPNPPTSEPGSFSLHVQSVPEPTSIALLGLGGAGAFGVFRRRKALCNAC